MPYPRRLVLTAAIALLAPAGITAAQDAKFPSRAVTLVVPFPPGGSADALPRTVAEKLRERWGQPVVIENRPGAAGSTGSGSVFRAPADGYTLLSTPAGPLAINGLVQKTLPYEPAAFVPISLLALSPTVLTVRLNFPASTAEEFIRYAKANPGKLNYASQGPGSTSHLTGVMFTQATGSDIVHVPYRGTGPALADILSGNVDLFFDNLGSSMPLYRAGKSKILAVATPERSKLIASQMGVDAMAKFINADSLAFVSIEGLYQALGDNRDAAQPQRCDACFTGDYPTHLTDFEERGESGSLSLVASR